MFPTSIVVANISPISQKRLKDMLTVADNFMKFRLSSAFSSMHETDGGLLAEM